MNETLLLRRLRSELFIFHFLGSRNDIDHATTLISKALQEAIEATISLLRECSRSVTG